MCSWAFAKMNIEFKSYQFPISLEVCRVKCGRHFDAKRRAGRLLQFPEGFSRVNQPQCQSTVDATQINARQPNIYKHTRTACPPLWHRTLRFAGDSSVKGWREHTFVNFIGKRTIWMVWGHFKLCGVVLKSTSFHNKDERRGALCSLWKPRQTIE